MLIPHIEADYGWPDIPSDVFKQIVSEWPVVEQIRLARVCKLWNNIIHHNEFGASDLAKVGLQASTPYSWLKLYRSAFLEAPQIIALDVSISMTEEREQQAIKKIAQLTKELMSPILFRGIGCMVFANKCYSETLYTVEDIESFFKGKYRQFTGPTLGGGTCINALFDELVWLEQQHLVEKANVHCHVTIISDFEDIAADISRLTDNHTQLFIQCINVGETKNRYVLKLTTDYEAWVVSEAIRDNQEQQERAEQEELFQQTIKVRRAKMQMPASEPIIFRGSQSAIKRHRNFKSVTPRTGGRKRKVADPITNHAANEYEAPLTMAMVDADSWQPLLKRRKIALPSPQETERR